MRWLRWVVAVRNPEFGSAEDLFQGILRRYFGDRVPVKTLFDSDGGTPLLVVRGQRRSGIFAGSGSQKFDRRRVMAVEALTSGLEADREGAQLLEAVEDALLRAKNEQWVIPNAGFLRWYEITSPPSRVSDWATATSVVQYAALPKGWVRWEMIVRARYGPASDGSGNEFLVP